MPATPTKPSATVITRFYCGCVHLTPNDTAVFCPHHYKTNTPAYITSREQVAAAPPNPRKPVSMRYPMGSSPEVILLQNDATNSLHSVSYVTDPQYNDWESPKSHHVGLCPPCFIDDGRLIQTRFARCECGDEECAYRWCGETQGLHGFWPIHAAGNSLKLTGIPESDIFSHGPHSSLPPVARYALEAASANLEREVKATARDYIAARGAARPSEGRNKAYNLLYLSHWLDRPYEAIIRAPLLAGQQAGASTELKQKLSRLLVMGAITVTTT